MQVAPRQPLFSFSVPEARGNRARQSRADGVEKGALSDARDAFPDALRAVGEGSHLCAIVRTKGDPREGDRLLLVPITGGSAISRGRCEKGGFVGCARCIPRHAPRGRGRFSPLRYGTNKRRPPRGGSPFVGADNRARTGTGLLPSDFKSEASASSAISACL